MSDGSSPYREKQSLQITSPLPLQAGHVTFSPQWEVSEGNDEKRYLKARR